MIAYEELNRALHRLTDLHEPGNPSALHTGIGAVLEDLWSLAGRLPPYPDTEKLRSRLEAEADAPAGGFHVLGKMSRDDG